MNRFVVREIKAFSRIPENNLLYKEVAGKKALATSYSQIDTFTQCPLKWYMTYVEGNRPDKKQEATSYGTVIHETLESFFKAGCTMTLDKLLELFNDLAAKEEIPFETEENKNEAITDAVNLLQWISNLFTKDFKGIFINEPSNNFETILRTYEPAGIEEPFNVKYKLPKPMQINDRLEEFVHIIGFIDLRLQKENNHVVVDWKSGRKLFDDYKLQNNLQHPIYGFHVLRTYGSLPSYGFYYFTRQNKFQTVIVDNERVNRSVNDLNYYFSRMYDFDSDYNKTANPTPLCYWCDFSKHKNNTCPFSSNYQKKK